MRLAKNPNDTLFLRSASSARLRLLVTAATVCAVFSATGLAAQEFQYDPVGQLIPGSGVGRVDSQVYVPGMRFPVESAPAYANSQVYRPGGNKYDRQLFPNGEGQCDARNFAYPWGDNYCEIRGWTMPRCPAGTGHQGQDIRGSSCADNTNWVVAAEDGVITSILSISVYLMNNAGTVRHRYLHMDRDRLEVTQGQAVKKGDRIGTMSNWSWHSGDQRRVKHWTTVHLHYDLKADGIYIPTYMSLVKSYENLVGVLGPFNGTFADDDDSPFEADIEAIYEAGITYGCAGGERPRYCPEDSVSRYHMAIFLVRALNLPLSSTNYFSDDNGHKYEQYANALAAAGITRGCGGGKFCGDSNTTRGEMITFLDRATSWSPSSTDYFDDDNGRFYEPHANAAKKAGVTNGCGVRKFCGQDEVTRGQLAAFLSRTLGLR
jgi:murein DD-endopeptidase MepM/ murein hydrolase activator NlpD